MQLHGAGDKHDIGAGGLGRGGNRKTLFAGGAVGDVAHGIDGLMRGTRGDQHALARQRSRSWRTQHMLGGSGNFHSLRHPADAGFAGFGHLAGIGTDRVDAIAAELHDIAAGGGVIPHQRIHRRRQQDRLARGEQNGAGEIVGMAMRHLRHEIRGGRRHYDQVAVARKTNVSGVELALGIEQIRIDALMGQRAGGQRRDELLRSLGQHAADLDMPLLQPADQFERFEGGDAAADDQGDARLPGNRLARGAIYHDHRGLRRGRRAVMLRGFPQDHPHLVLDRAAVARRPQPQFVMNGVVELADAEVGHGASRGVC